MISRTRKREGFFKKLLLPPRSLLKGSKKGYFFLAVVFLAAGFLATVFFAVVFLAAGFLAIVFFFAVAMETSLDV